MLEIVKLTVKVGIWIIRMYYKRQLLSLWHFFNKTQYP